MEFYEGKEWRKNKGTELKRCIQRILEAELEDEYQRNSEPSEEVRRKLKEKEERAKTKQNMSAGEFCQMKKSEGRKEAEQLELYPN